MKKNIMKIIIKAKKIKQNKKKKKKINFSHFRAKGLV